MTAKYDVKTALLILLCIFIAGCDRGPPVGTVKGTVTLDGKPVDGGTIRFVPANGDSQPADAPITQGAYSITMPLGEKKVEVYWGKNASGREETDTVTQGTAQFVETIPLQYNSQTTLKHTIAEGEAVQDFALTTK